MNNIKIVAIDLDGTLLDSNKKISTANLLAIKKTISAGYTVVLATGRALTAIPKELLEEDRIKYIISANGAVIYHMPDREIVGEDFLSHKIVREIYEILKKENISISIYCDGIVYMSADDYKLLDTIEGTLAEIQYMKWSRTVVNNIDEMVKECDIPKITINFRKNSIDTKGLLLERLKNNECITVVSGGDNSFEITAKTASKGNALKKLASLLGIDLNSVMVIGDSENDISMFKEAGWSIAMKNSEKELFNYADDITDDNNLDGVKKALYKYLGL